MPVPPKPKPPKSTPLRPKSGTPKARKGPGYSTALTPAQGRAQRVIGKWNAEADQAYREGRVQNTSANRSTSRAKTNKDAKSVAKNTAARERYARQLGMYTTASQKTKGTVYPVYASTGVGARKAPTRMSNQTRKTGGRKG